MIVLVLAAAVSYDDDSWNISHMVDNTYYAVSGEVYPVGGIVGQCEDLGKTSLQTSQQCDEFADVANLPFEAFESIWDVRGCYIATFKNENNVQTSKVLFNSVEGENNADAASYYVGVVDDHVRRVCYGVTRVPSAAPSGAPSRSPSPEPTGSPSFTASPTFSPTFTSCCSKLGVTADSLAGTEVPKQILNAYYKSSNPIGVDDFSQNGFAVNVELPEYKLIDVPGLGVSIVGVDEILSPLTNKSYWYFLNAFTLEPPFLKVERTKRCPDQESGAFARVEGRLGSTAYSPIELTIECVDAEWSPPSAAPSHSPTESPTESPTKSPSGSPLSVSPTASPTSHIDGFCHPKYEKECPTELADELANVAKADRSEQHNASLAANAPAIPFTTDKNKYEFCVAPVGTDDGSGRARCTPCTATKAEDTVTGFALTCPFLGCGAYRPSSCPPVVCNVVDNRCTPACDLTHFSDIDDGNRRLTSVDYGGSRDATPLTVGGLNAICTDHVPDITGFTARSHRTSLPFFVFKPASVDISNISDSVDEEDHRFSTLTSTATVTTTSPAEAECELLEPFTCLERSDCVVYGANCYPVGYSFCSTSTSTCEPNDWYYIALFSLLGAYTLIELVRAWVWPFIRVNVFNLSPEKRPLLSKAIF